MGKLEAWQRGVEEFAFGWIGDPPARVLEVGCGEGELARALAGAGHLVTAIDPRAPEGAIFRRVRIEEFAEPGPFDCVVASLSLHHVEDLGGVLEKIAGLLRTRGTLVVVEYAFDRFDERTAAWAFSRLPTSHPEKISWLQRRCREWARGGQGAFRAPAEGHLARRAEEGLHGSQAMLEDFGRRFDERYFEWVPYLYPDLDDGTSEADERAAIEAGTIGATGFRYVGTVMPPEQRSRAR